MYPSIRLVFQVSAIFLLVINDEVTSEEVRKCNVTGGPHGSEFDDTEFFSPGQDVTAFKLCGVDVVDGVGALIIASSGEMQYVLRGLDKECREYKLGPKEHITSIEVHSAKIDSKTRVGFVKLSNQEGKTYEVGKMLNRGKEGISECTAPEGYQLAGFYGRGGDGIYALGALWALIPQSRTEVTVYGDV